MRKQMKKYLAFLTFGVWVVGMKPDKIKAQDLTETMEKAKEGESTADYVENGILVLENRGNCAAIELRYADNHYTVQCDYSEYEIPMGTLFQLEIHPHFGYQVDFVEVNQNLVSPENGIYEILMQEGFTEISVGYVEKEDRKNSTVNEIFKDNRITNSGKDSVSAISREITVTYLNGEEDQPVCGESIAEVSEDDVVQIAESENVEEILPEEISVNGEENGSFEKVEEQELPEAEQKNEEIESEQPDVLKREKEPKINKNTSEKTSYTTPENDKKSNEIPAETTVEIKKKSSLNILNFPLYLCIICCILVVRYRKMDKISRGNKWIEE